MTPSLKKTVRLAVGTVVGVAVVILVWGGIGAVLRPDASQALDQAKVALHEAAGDLLVAQDLYAGQSEWDGSAPEGLRMARHPFTMAQASLISMDTNGLSKAELECRDGLIEAARRDESGRVNADRLIAAFEDCK